MKTKTRLSGSTAYRDYSDWPSHVPKDLESLWWYLKFPCLSGVSDQLQRRAWLCSRC